jgi:hypothetical protein
VVEVGGGSDPCATTIVQTTDQIRQDQQKQQPFS